MRINNSTYESKKGVQQALDLLRMSTDVVEPPEEGVTEILRAFEEAIVCDVFAGIVPHPFRRV